jgi:hypothetical protein
LRCEKLVAFCADNAPVNFGGPNHQGENSVFSRLRARQESLVPIGCPAHILHNAARKASENLPIDMEAIIFKIASHFRTSSKRMERLSEICDEFDV